MPSRTYIANNCKIVAYTKNNEFHRVGKPACCRYLLSNNQLIEESYYYRGQLHNRHGPAIRRWTKSGKLIAEEHYIKGKRQDPCPTVPAMRKWFTDGTVKYEAHYNKGVISNIHGFASRQINKDGSVEEYSYVNGTYTCVVLPTSGKVLPSYRFTKNGVALEELWLKDIGPKISYAKPNRSKCSTKMSTVAIYRNTAGAVIREIKMSCCHITASVSLKTIDYDSTGVVSVRWEKDGQIHYSYGPALKLFRDGKCISEQYYYHGQLNCPIGKNWAVVRYDPLTTRPILKQKWHHGQLHSTDGPAEISYYPDSGNHKSEKWYYYGIAGRDTSSISPSEVHYDPNRNVICRRWFKKGHLHRSKAPAEITYYSNGQIKSEHWYKDGQPCRLGAPAEIHYDQYGSVLIERWYINGKLGRFNAPAEINYDTQGQVKSEHWYRDGLLYREGLPAVLCYQNGSVIEERYYSNGQLVDGLAIVTKNSDGSIELGKWSIQGKIWKTMNMTNLETELAQISKKVDSIK